MQKPKLHLMTSTRFSRVFRRVDGVKRGANDLKTSWQGVWCTWSRCAVVKIHNFAPRQDATLDPEPFGGLRSSLNSLQPHLSRENEIYIYYSSSCSSNKLTAMLS